MMSFGRRVQVSAVVMLALVGGGVSPRRTALEERIADRRAIEEVYWRHRIWPSSNSRPKPSLDQSLPETAIRSRVEDDLAKVDALRKFWGLSVSDRHVQDEIDRMVTQTKSPDMLKEIFAALGGDPRRIAATVARPAVVDRQLRTLYARDGRFHAALRRLAERERAEIGTASRMKRAGGWYSEFEFLERSAAGIDPPHPDSSLPAQVLGPEEWRDLVARLARTIGPWRPAVVGIGDVGPSLSDLPLREISDLQEGDDRYYASALLAAEPGRLRLATVAWLKRPFGDWWAEVRGDLSVDPLDSNSSYVLPPMPATAAAPCAEETWTPLRRTAPPYERIDHTAVWTGSEMIIWGGHDATGWLNDGHRYDPATDTWAPIRADSSAPTPRDYHTAVWTGSEMIIWGGRSAGAASGVKSGGRYEPVSDTWTPTGVDTGAPEGRYQHTAVWTGSEMIVWGGLGTGGARLDTGGRYDPTLDRWRPTRADLSTPSPRNGHTAVWTESEMIVWGANFASPSNTGGRYNPVSDTWLPTRADATTPAARYGHTAVWTGSEMIIWGGFGASAFLSSGGRYVPSTDGWTPTGSGQGVPNARYEHTAVWTGSEMIVWGGQGGGFLKSGGRYRPSTDDWSVTSTGAGVPDARFRHSAVWTGSEMIVWGGGVTNFLFGTGGRYDPAADTWQPTDVDASAPGARRYHTAIWTGAEMIVWGGHGFLGYLNSGERYDPATDNWTPTGTAGAIPTPRGDHTAVWTGAEMIVWGGSDGAVALNTGGVYDPVNDGWRATRVDGSTPAPGASNTAVWTGTEMILWGASRGRYDPALDGWRSIAANPALFTFSHSAVWSGRHMIVWGGSSGSAFTNNGGRYDPVTDGWVATRADASTPAARGQHTAVWTGSEMIVWGGVNRHPVSQQITYLNTGGRYNPSTNSWAATGLEAATPTGRAYHQAVWTGAEMIVWGGSGGAVSVNTGGRYDPVGGHWSSTRVDGTTPVGSFLHTMVWAGTRMIVWGGMECCASGWTTNSGAAYCACPPYYPDADGDGYGDAGSSITSCNPPSGYSAVGGDCDDADADVWRIPGEVRDLMFTDGATFTWLPPMSPGSTTIVYDALGSNSAADFITSGTACVVSNSPDPAATDGTLPPVDSALYYLVRAENGCPGGLGPLGFDSNGSQRFGLNCP